ncbi:MAG: glycosyltransferase family 9 protein [Candidatus Omnitrophica bacterium]|nr:glycosyltransferase family 9 protein [Candidatus Omnitrophota bacterium]
MPAIDPITMVAYNHKGTKFYNTTMKKYKLKQSCRFFRADRPCFYHKEFGSVCDDCDKYSPVNYKILIIKLGAFGDVLRTTALCEPLKLLYPGSMLFWITENNAIAILQGNRFVDRIIGKESASALVSYFKFDLLINLDLDDEALILAGISNAKEKKGFWFDSNGFVKCSSPVAQEYFLLSHDDRLKKQNVNTYQSIIASISGLPNFGKIIVPISDASKKNAQEFTKRYNLREKKTLGVVVGTGNRWITKKWPEKNFLELFSMLDDFNILIFGGPEEKELLERIVEKSNKTVINTGYSNSIDYFFGLLDLCDIVVCCDTFALHAAVGLGKKVVALFGPTSSSEVEMYGHGEKIASDISCICCYKKECFVQPNCMELITPQRVFQVVRRLAGEK